jgi:hypothetical protein
MAACNISAASSFLSLWILDILSHNEGEKNMSPKIEEYEYVEVAGEINHVFHSSLNVLDIVFTK